MEPKGEGPDRHYLATGGSLPRSRSRGRQDHDGVCGEHQELSRRPPHLHGDAAEAVSVFRPGRHARVTPITHAGAGGPAAAPSASCVRR